MSSDPAFVIREVITNHLGQVNPTAVGTPTPEINVQGGSPAMDIPDGDTTPTTSDDTDFGSVLTAGGIDTNTFTIQNTGTGPLTVTGITVSGAHPTDFTVTNFTPGVVAIGGMLTFDLVFDPIADGTRTATVEIANDDADENPYDFAVTGTGSVAAVPEINVQGGTPAIDIADGDITPSLADGTDFASTLTSGGSRANMFLIENLGTGPLDVTAINVTGAHNSDFVVSGFTPGSIAAGANGTFIVTFDPSADGTRNATIEIVSDDADENPYNFDVTGVGVDASVLNSIVFNEVLPDPNSTTLNFDTDGDGTAEADDEFLEIYNTTATPLDISGLQFWDTAQGNYFSVPAGTTLGANGFAVVVADIVGGTLPTVAAGSLAFSTGGAMSLSNSGDDLIVYDPATDQYIQGKYRVATFVDPTTIAGFSATASLLGTPLDFGNDTAGTSRAEP